MRRLFGLVAAVALVVGVSAPASATSLLLKDSTLTITISPLLSAVFVQSPDPHPISVTSTSGGFVLPAGLLAGTTFPPIQLFTGVSFLSSMTVAAANGTMSVGGFNPGAVVGPLAGSVLYGFLGSILKLPLPLSVVGAAGTNAAIVSTFEVGFNVTGMSWTTGTGMITGISTRTPNGAVVNTVTISGSDNRTAGGVGTLTLVSPARVLWFGDLSHVGLRPLTAVMSLRFVPEPGELLLLVSGLGALLLVARRRMRK